MNKYHGVFKLLPVPDKKWVHISIDFIIAFPVSRDFVTSLCYIRAWVETSGNDQQTGPPKDKVVWLAEQWKMV